MTVDQITNISILLTTLSFAIIAWFIYEIVESGGKFLMAIKKMAIDFLKFIAGLVVLGLTGTILVYFICLIYFSWYSLIIHILTK